MGRSPLRLAVESALTRLEVSLDRLHPAPQVTAVELRSLLERAEAIGGLRPLDIDGEPALTAVEMHVREAAQRHHVGGPERIHDGDLAFARICYVLCRLVRPSSVVETGVGNGVSTSFLLQALAVNGSGRLASIDLPPPGVAESSVGTFVPLELTSRWDLQFGPTRTMLPPLLDGLDGVGMFVHDSRHTYRNVRRELRLVSPRLTPPAAVVVDDAERNSAFFDWIETVRPQVSGVLEPSTKVGLIGAALLL